MQTVTSHAPRGKGNIVCSCANDNAVPASNFLSPRKNPPLMTAMSAPSTHSSMASRKRASYDHRTPPSAVALTSYKTTSAAFAGTHARSQHVQCARQHGNQNLHVVKRYLYECNRDACIVLSFPTTLCAAAAQPRSVRQCAQRQRRLPTQVRQ
jgi:hypothetical protein